MKRLANGRADRVKGALLPALILMVVGVAIFFVSGAFRVFGLFAPKTLAQLTPDNAEGAFVRDTVYMLYGQFIEEQQYRNGEPTGEITARYYVTDFDEDTYYFALCAHREDLDNAEAMMEACLSVMDGSLDPAQLPSLRVWGFIRPMSDEELGYYYDSVDNDAETTDGMLPLCLDVGRISGLTAPAVAVIIFVSLALFLWGGGMLIYACLTPRPERRAKAETSITKDPWDVPAKDRDPLE